MPDAGVGAGGHKGKNQRQVACDHSGRAEEADLMAAEIGVPK
jgi:hypothetical protein